MPILCLGFLPIARQLQKLRAYSYKRCMQAFSLSGHAGRCPQLGVILHLSRKMMATKVIKKKSLWHRSTTVATFYEKQTVCTEGQADSEDDQTGQSTAGYSRQVPCLEKI